MPMPIEWSEAIASDAARKRRDRFAAAALQGLLTSETDGDRYVEHEVARYAVALADALIAELDRKGGSDGR